MNVIVAKVKIPYFGQVSYRRGDFPGRERTDQIIVREIKLIQGLQHSNLLSRFVKFPIEAGISPVRLLLDKETSIREPSIPISFGKDPEILLSERTRRNKLVKSPIQGGTEPVRMFLNRKIIGRQVQSSYKGHFHPKKRGKTDFDHQDWPSTLEEHRLLCYLLLKNWYVANFSGGVVAENETISTMQLAKTHRDYWG
ncbi:hypothetical protein GQ457_07G037940 [Hibiscus cannabinus]